MAVDWIVNNDPSARDSGGAAEPSPRRRAKGWVGGRAGSAGAFLAQLALVQDGQSAGESGGLVAGRG